MDRNTSKQRRFIMPMDPMTSAQSPVPLGMSHEHQPHQTSRRTINDPQPQRYQPSRSWSQDKNNDG